jgi:hypothetical protein
MLGLQKNPAGETGPAVCEVRSARHKRMKVHKLGTFTAFEQYIMGFSGMSIPITYTAAQGIDKALVFML